MSLSSSWRTRLHQVGLGLGAILFVWQAWSALTALAEQRVQIAQPWLLAAGGLSVLVATLFQIAAWRLIMSDLNAQLGWRDSLRGYALPFVARYIPGMVWGYLSRTHWLETRHGIAPERANLGALIEVVALVLSAALAAAVAGVLAGEMELAVAGGLGLLAGLMGLAIARRLGKGSTPFHGWVERLLGLDWSSEVTFRRVLRAVPGQLGLWLFDGVMVWMSLAVIGVSIDGSVWVAVADFALAWLAGFLVFLLPAGLGLREISLSFMLTRYLGVGAAEAAAVSILARATFVMAELCYVVFGFVIGPSDTD